MSNKGNSVKQKRISYEGTARILKKSNTWTYRSMPGGHSKDSSAAISLILRDILGLVDNSREARYVLANKTVLVNGRRVKSQNYPVGIFDILELKELGKKYRTIFDKKGYIAFEELDKKAPLVRYSKIVGKTSRGKNVQINLDNGFNIDVDKDVYQVKDTIILEVPSNKIVGKVEFANGSNAFIVGGPHIGKEGKIKEIFKGNLGKKEEVIIEGKELNRTISEYVIVIPEPKKSEK